MSSRTNSTTTDKLRGGGTVAVELSPTNVIREFSRIREAFPNIRRQEEVRAESFWCMEQQIAWMVHHDPSLLDEDVNQALSAAGLRAYDALTSGPERSWSRLDPRVQQLAWRLSATFDPDVNEEVRHAAEKAWRTLEERQKHFTEWGAVIARLIDSVKFHSKKNPRGYCQWVVPALTELGNNLDDGATHWVIWSRSVPEGVDLP